MPVGLFRLSWTWHVMPKDDAAAALARQVALSFGRFKTAANAHKASFSCKMAWWSTRPLFLVCEAATSMQTRTQWPPRHVHHTHQRTFTLPFQPDRS
jgi:hypothetical protein